MGGFGSAPAALAKLKKFLVIKDHHLLTLFRCTPDTLVRTDKNLAPLRHIGSPEIHGYTDQQPIHINSLSSVHTLSKLLPPEQQPLDARRFRANIWITGAPAYDEDTWKRYRILPRSTAVMNAEPRASVSPTMSVVCRTSRCTIPNVDPETGAFSADGPAPGKKIGEAQPSTTLVKHRTVETGNSMALGYIGMHCVPEDKSLDEAKKPQAGLYIQVGDEVQILEIGAHLYGSTGNDY